MSDYDTCRSKQTGSVESEQLARVCHGNQMCVSAMCFRPVYSVGGLESIINNKYNI